MKRMTEKIRKMTGRELVYDGKDHVELLSDHATSLMEYVNRVSDADVFVKHNVLDNHIAADPANIKVHSFSDINEDLICYALVYGTSVTPFFVSGYLA